MSESEIVDGELKPAYYEPETYGESCAAHDVRSYTDNDYDRYKLERWYANRLAVRPTMRYAMGEAIYSIFYTP